MNFIKFDLTHSDARSIEYVPVVIRRFRVRIPGRITVSCWPNGKAPDYGCIFLRYFLFGTMHLDWMLCMQLLGIDVHLFTFA